MMTGYGEGGFIAPDAMWFISGAAAMDTFTPAVDLVMVLNSTGTITSTFSMTREQAMALMSSIAGSSTFTLSGTFSLSLLSDMYGSSLQAMAVGSYPDLHTGGVVWVVNMDTSASAQYEEYGFNSFFTRDGIFYGVAGNGIYKLEGASDDGAEILSTIVLGKEKFGTRDKKRVLNVYAGLSSTGIMVLKVETDGATYYYNARNSDTDLENQRFDIGRGLKGNYWQFTIINSSGCDFSLESIQYTPIELSRGI